MDIEAKRAALWEATKAAGAALRAFPKTGAMGYPKQCPMTGLIRKDNAMPIGNKTKNKEPLHFDDVIKDIRAEMYENEAAYVASKFGKRAAKNIYKAIFSDSKVLAHLDAGTDRVNIVLFIGESDSPGPTYSFSLMELFEGEMEDRQLYDEGPYFDAADRTWAKKRITMLTELAEKYLAMVDLGLKVESNAQ